MPERVVEVCTICHRELSDDDHKVSEHGDGWAHDECVADVREAALEEGSEPPKRR